MARRKLVTGRIQLWGHPIAVDWAEPEEDVDDDVMKEVKVLYVRNLLIDTSEDILRNHFQQFGKFPQQSFEELSLYCHSHHHQKFPK